MLPGIDEFIRHKPIGLPDLSKALVEASELGEVVGASVYTDRPRQVELEIWRKVFERSVKVAAVERLKRRRTISTFSCDIAYSESPAASRASSRVQYSRPTAIFASRSV